jgi:hypothetical protein
LPTKFVLRTARRSAVAAALAAVLTAGPATADIFATYDRSCEGSSLETRNVTTGASEALPAAASDVSDELHPSLSPDRTRLVFLRRRSGTVRVVVVDRATGQSADLFNAFEAAADPPTTPVFSQDGKKVITGRLLEHRDPASPSGALQASFTQTDVTNFPNGPFPHQIVAAGGLDSTSPGRTVQPTTFGASSFAFGIEYDSGGPPGRVTLQQGDGAATLADSATRLGNPTISPSTGVVVYESTPAAASSDTKLVFRPLAGFATAPTTALPGLVNGASGTSATNPAFSRDGRYLAFVRRPPTSSSRLFVWDTQTQLLLKSDGVNICGGPNRTEGGIALDVRQLILSSRVTSNSLTFTLATNSSVGIIVQRIVGKTRVLGHSAPKLRFVGRVPLGSFKRDWKNRVRWDRKVNGRKLAPGSYLVTVRSVTRKGQVRDLGKPVRVRIR